MSTQDFKTCSNLFKLEVRGFVVLSFELRGATLIELAVNTQVFIENCEYW